MKKHLGRTITALRKKRGLSQKDAAAELGISQALLSPYEKGIRECGLEFIVRLADYYEVSTDYLLGRSSEAASETLTEDDYSDAEIARSNTQCLLNRRLAVNSAAVIYSLLSKINNKKLTKHVSDYLFVAEYNMFRKIYSIKENNHADIFRVTYPFSATYCSATLSVTDARIKEASQNLEGMSLSVDSLSQDYGESFPALNELIKNAEKTIIQNHRIS